MANFKQLFYDLKAKAERRREESAGPDHVPEEGARQLGERIYRLYVQYRPDVEGKTCLEIGVGNGWAVHGLLEAGAAHVDGIDVSTERINQARERLAQTPHQNHAFWVDDAETLERCPSDHYDYVNFSDVLEHLQDCERSMASIRRVLKPGGLVYIKTPNDFVDANLRSNHLLHLLFAGMLPSRIEPPAGEGVMLLDDQARLTPEEVSALQESVPDDFREHNRQFDPASLKDFVESAGFQVDRLGGIPLFSNIMYVFMNQIPRTCQFYCDFISSDLYAEFLNCLHADMQAANEHPEFKDLPTDYVFADNLIVIARKS